MEDSIGDSESDPGEVVDDPDELLCNLNEVLALNGFHIVKFTLQNYQNIQILSSQTNQKNKPCNVESSLCLKCLLRKSSPSFSINIIGGENFFNNDGDRFKDDSPTHGDVDGEFDRLFAAANKEDGFTILSTVGDELGDVMET